MTPALIVFAHFFGDWILQSREVATNKSSSLRHLLIHIFIYWAVITITGFGLFGLVGVKWALINSIIHGLWDWYYYKVIKRVFSKTVTPDNYFEKKVFWDSIAVDQMFHLIVLFVTL